MSDHDFADDDARCLSRCEAHRYLGCPLCREDDAEDDAEDDGPLPAPGYPGTSRFCYCEEDAGDNADCPLHGIWE